MNSPGATSINWYVIIKQLILTGLVTVTVLSVLIGITIYQNSSNDTVVGVRPALLAGFAGFAMAVRFIAVMRQIFKDKASETAADSASTRNITFFKNSRRYLQPILIALMACFPFIMLASLGAQGSTKWIDNYGIIIMIYIMLGWGLNIVVGLAGLLDLGYVAFYAIGSYTYALLAQHYGFSFWMALPVAGVMAALWGVILGFPVLRLRGDYLAVVTLAFGEIIRSVAVNWRELTNGSAGISVPSITFFGLPFNSSEDGFAAYFSLEPMPIYRSIFLYYVIFTLAVLTAFVTVKLKKLPIGRAWEALREDEIACRSLGLNTRNTKLTAFAIGALFGGLAGAFFGARQGFLTPESFSFEESVLILATVVFGGMGSLTGVVLAAVALFGGMEILREFSFIEQFIGIDPNRLRMLVVGVGMVLMMLWKPRGLISTRVPTIFLKEQKAVAGSLVKEGHG